MNVHGYNAAAKWLHRITLGSRGIAEISFDIERALYADAGPALPGHDQPVFVSGLARSGTTALLRALYDTRLFASLTYADMPFILAPNLWRTLSPGRHDMEHKERAHQDGIFVNAESPEAFDEVFWKVCLRDRYILPDRLVVNDVTAEVLALYQSYIRLILKKNDNGRPLRYLSKNNNNVLRLQSIIAGFPRAVIIIPFRDPVQHALSLLSQHIHFCRLQAADRFVLEYMNWIGHHEFGLNQKPFALADAGLLDRLVHQDRCHINYWLLTWMNYYSFVLDHFADACFLFSYETFCREPATVLLNVFPRIGVPCSALDIQPFQAKARSDSGADGSIVKECYSLYQKLLDRMS